MIYRSTGLGEQLLEWAEAFRKWLPIAPSGGYAREAQGHVQAAAALDDTRQISFTFAIIALSAKLANVDGMVSKQSYWAFREVFPMQASEDTKIRSLFLMAMNERSQPDQYVRQILRLFPEKPALYREIVHRLLKVATASDPRLTAAQYDYLQRVAIKLGLSRREWKKLLGVYSAPKAQDPYKVLGISKSADAATVKAAHRRLVRATHPDGFSAAGASPDMVDMLAAKMAEINAAYDEVRREQNRKGA